MGRRAARLYPRALVRKPFPFDRQISECVVDRCVVPALCRVDGSGCRTVGCRVPDRNLSEPVRFSVGDTSANLFLLFRRLLFLAVPAGSPRKSYLADSLAVSVPGVGE